MSAVAHWDGAALAIAGAASITAASIEHHWNALSHFPDRRARMELEGLAARLNGFSEFVRALAERAESPIDADSEIARFVDRHVTLTRAYWASEGRCMSWFITGPARFPVARNRKRMDSADNKRAAIAYHASRARRSLTRRAFPYGEPGGAIRSDRPDAIALIEKKMAELEALQARMKQVNQAHAAFARRPDAPRTLDLLAKLRPFDEALVRRYVPEYSWEPHPFAPCQLQNNGAEIRRLRGRLDQLKAAQGRETKTHQTNAGFEIIENAEACRVQLVFPGKPSPATRQLLKSNGFRWAPSAGAWQRLLNNAGIDAARRIRSALETETAAGG